MHAIRKLVASFDLGLLFIAVMSAAHASEPAALGAPEFRPSPARPLGWRGDGSGVYLGASKAPVHWSRTTQSLTERLRCAASAPADDQPGASKPLSSNGIAYYPGEWLVLGGLTVPDTTNNFDAIELVPGEKTMKPVAGQQVAGKTWRRIDNAGMRLDVAKAIEGGMQPGEAAILMTWIWSPENGKVSWNHEWWTAEFKKGWNPIVRHVRANAKGACSHDVLALLSTAPKYQETNIPWVRPLMGGYSQPVIVGERLFVTTGMYWLLCLDKQSGKVLWFRRSSEFEAAQTEKGAFAENAKARELLDSIDAAVKPYLDDPSKSPGDVGNIWWNQYLPLTKTDTNYAFTGWNGWGGGLTTATPATDGKLIFVYHGDNGLAACFDLDGNRKWTRYQRTNGAHHGINASPVPVGDKVILLGAGFLIAYDKETGKTAWKVPGPGLSYGTPIAAQVGKRPVIVCADGSVFFADDGTQLSGAQQGFDGECASAVVVGRRFWLFARGGVGLFELPADEKGKVEKLKGVGKEFFRPDAEPYPVASPVVHNGIFYGTSSGWGSGDGKCWLYALDAATLDLIWKERLDERYGFNCACFYNQNGAGQAASLTIAGGHLYVMDNRGTTLVLEPGRTFRILSTNLLRHMPNTWDPAEVTESTPVFDGSRMYYHGANNLYCIEEK